MDELFAAQNKKKGLNKGFLVAIVVAFVVVAVIVGVLLMRPSLDQQKAAILAGSYQPGSPEYDDLQKDIIISTDPDTVQSPTGMGTISMFIKGKIRNKGTRTITALEVNVAVVSTFNQVLKERKILVVPVQQAELGPGEIIPITLTLDGFSRDDDRANIRWKVTAIRA